MNWYLAVLKKYADFSGRARRKEYWIFTLFNMIFLITAMILDNVLGTAIEDYGFGLFYILYGLATFIPGIAVVIRRLHDVGKSGWMFLIFMIPIIGGIWLFILLVTDSNPGENQYGPNPKGDKGDIQYKESSVIKTEYALEYQQQSTIKPSLTYGLLLGAAVIVYSLIMYLLDIDYDSKIQWIAYLIIAGGIFWAMITFRDKLSGGFISYIKALGVGFWTGLFAAVLSAIFTYIYVTMIVPGIIEEILLNTEDKILERSPDMSDEQLEMALSYTEKLTSPIWLTIWDFLPKVFFATILSLIIAIFVKREATIEIVEEEVTEE